MGVSRHPSTVRPCFARNPLDDAFALQTRMPLDGQERHAHAIFARGRERESQPGALAREKGVRDLNQHAGAIPGFRIAAAGPAVRQVDEDLDTLEDDVVRLLTVDAGDKAYAAGLVFMARIVKTLRGR